MADKAHRKSVQELISAYLTAEQSGSASAEPLWGELEQRLGKGLYSELLYTLTRQRFDSAEAGLHWQRIQEHRLGLKKDLGRDIGTRTALVDYFININPEMKNPVLVEDGLLRQQENCALRDDLTGLFNRRFFRGLLEKQVAEAIRYHTPFSLLMIDVDHFKAYNDRMGHPAGDRVLASLAGVLGATARIADFVVRYGGEEFAIVLPKSDKAQATAAARRHLDAVRSHEFAGQQGQPGGNLTISIGVANFPADAGEAESLVEQADRALYRAKAQGRDQVVTATAERRRHPRRPYRAPVELRCPDMGGQPLTGETLDISIQGLGLGVNVPVEEGRPVELSIRAGDIELELRVQGRVVRVEQDQRPGYPFLMGVSLDSEMDDGPFAELLNMSGHTLH